MKTEKMIDGVGFCLDGEPPPSYEQCQRMVAESAYMRWAGEGMPPGRELEFWTAAERDLFKCRDGAYFVPVCDLTQPCNKRHLRYWDVLRVSPEGVGPAESKRR